MDALALLKVLDLASHDFYVRSTDFFKEASCLSTCSLLAISYENSSMRSACLSRPKPESGLLFRRGRGKKNTSCVFVLIFPRTPVLPESSRICGQQLVKILNQRTSCRCKKKSRFDMKKQLKQV